MLIRNLVDNAVRYTPDGGSVRVRTAVANGRSSLSVSDSGPGIPASERDAVLRRFHRLNRGGQPTGSGLGLAIVARIAELHGADLDLAEGESTQGLRVTVTWPVPAPAGRSIALASPSPCACKTQAVMSGLCRAVMSASGGSGHGAEGDLVE